MSNPAVGNVYQAIIDEVVNSSRVDFEESGVEESVLEELRQVRDTLFVEFHVLSAILVDSQESPRNGREKPVSSTKTSVDIFQLRTLSYSTNIARPKTAGSFS